MKYFLPDWDDRIDPGFDFVADRYTKNRNVQKHDVYAHEVFERPPYDGLLVSRAVVEKGRSRNRLINRVGVHKAFRVPEDFPILGDCGAFSYVEEQFPRYEVGDVLAYYHRIGVNYGVSVDHLVFDSMEESEKRRRMDITLRNAFLFLQGHRSKAYKYTPYGVAQGWSPSHYAGSAWQLLDMGYRSLALGGLARSSAKDILAVLVEVSKAIRDFKTLRGAEEIDLHLFGVAKVEYARRFRDLGVTSIDSASHLRKAWLRSGQNYWTVSDGWYTAIRVPQSTNPKVRAYISQNGRELTDVVRREQRVLRLLRAHQQHRLSEENLEKLLNVILEYDDYLLRAGDDGREMRNKTLSRQKYLKVLHERPWENCSCAICREVGVQVVIFRGTNRNKRRGFHNVWVFYQKLQEALR